ncbi:MAG: substrate-binding domain-containing protein [Kiritimatiellae bacterium]|nr:substrate-binding domain-containing protein [Kiritimatiellia bacterium]
MKRTVLQQSIRKVAVAVKLSDASWRDFLTGFFDYAKRKTHWDIRVLQSSMELEQATASCDGVVTGMEPSRNTQAVVAHKSIPLVAIGAEWKLKHGNAPVAFIRNDNEDIGRFCAKHFRSFGQFASAGFVPSDAEDDWSSAREKGFFDGFGDIARSVFGVTPEPGSDADIAALADWLTSLPKPAAVMAAWDMRAVHVLSACRLARLKVPGQVAVIGVDNDPLLCDFTVPPLTSVAPDHALEGQIAAETIDHMMRRRDGPKTLHVLNTAKKMAERESAKPISPVTALIARALAFIAAHADENIKAANVSDALGVSRSLLDLRFREFRGETVAKAIARHRLEAVKRLLSDTGLSIRAISAKCGFANANHLKNAFKRSCGMSMREFRSGCNGSGRRQCAAERASH